MNQPSIAFPKEIDFELEIKNKQTSKFLKMFEVVNKETEEQEENTNDIYLETFLPKDLFKDCNNYEEEKNEKDENENIIKKNIIIQNQDQNKNHFEI